MNEYNKESHTVYDIKYHVIWVTKYRYRVLIFTKLSFSDDLRIYIRFNRKIRDSMVV